MRGPFKHATGARAAIITIAQVIGGNVPGGLRWRYNSSLPEQPREASHRAMP